MIPASVMMKLATLGLTEAQAEAVATMLTDVEAATAAVATKAVEATVEKGREKARARWHTWNNKRLLTAANVSSQLARVEDSSSKKDISGKEEKKEGAAKPRGLDDFKAELSSILDAERIDALVAVRRKKGATFSALAGRSLSKALRSWPNINEAADEMVLRNWTGFKPDWMAKRGTGPPSKPKTIGDIFRDDAKRMGLIPNDNPPDPTPERLAISDRSREGSGPGIARRFAVPSNILGELG